MDKSLLILFATMTGNAEYVAKAVGEAARQHGFEPTLANVCDYGFGQLAGEVRVLLIASTYGEGDPPPDAEDFQDWLRKQQPPLLAGQRFSVYALGDTSYDQFCGFGKRLDTEFERLGAQRIAERSDNDLDYEEGLAAWMHAVFAGLEKTETAAIA